MDWNALVRSIEDGEAVLVLGPDAIPYYHGDRTASFSELNRRAILERVDGGVLHHYERDHLFQFRDARAKRTAMKSVRDTARNEAWRPDTELLRQIVALPFPVILNLNPDKHLYDAFAQYWRAPQFDYFTTRDKPELFDLSHPDGHENPLLYHLAGSVEDKIDSTVLDYHDLFDLLKNLLSDHGVPEVLTRKLRETDHYVLLGFELERWYLQLFLHYINQLDSPFDNYNQNYPILCELSEDSRQFIIKQFNITHHSLSRVDFDAIYAACAERGILRELRDPGSPAQRRLRQAVIQGDYTAAFAELSELLDTTAAQIDLPLLQSQYQQYREQEQSGTASEAELNLQLNRVRYALLSFIHNLPADG